MKPGSGGWNLKMKSRLRLKVCEARQRGRNLKMKSRLSPPELRQGWWNLKMKSRLRLKVCEARQGGIEFKDEVYDDD